MAAPARRELFFLKLMDGRITRTGGRTDVDGPTDGRGCFFHFLIDGWTWMDRMGVAALYKLRRAENGKRLVAPYLRKLEKERK